MQNINKTQLDYLLQPLGIEVVTSDGLIPTSTNMPFMWKLVFASNKDPIGLGNTVSTSSGKYDVYHSIWIFIDSLTKDLTMYGKQFINLNLKPNDRKRLDNPYFGCKSLEEMLVKKDLIDQHA